MLNGHFVRAIGVLVLGLAFVLPTQAFAATELQWFGQAAVKITSPANESTA